MLGKLLKYELKSTSRLLGIIYLAILVLSLVLGLSGRSLFQEAVIENSLYMNEALPVQHTLPFLLLMTIYILLVMALVIITFVAIITRFYKSLLKGEGYLMNTLPVPTWMLVASKTISSFIWEILGTAAVIISLLIIAFSSGFMQLALQEFLPYVYEGLNELLGRGYTGTIVLFVVDMIIQSVCTILSFYVAMAIGGAARKHKKLFSVVAFICIMIIMEIVALVCNLGDINGLMDLSTGVPTNLVFAKDIVANAIYSVIFFILTTFFLKKKLNLE